MLRDKEFLFLFFSFCFLFFAFSLGDYFSVVLLSFPPVNREAFLFLSHTTWKRQCTWPENFSVISIMSNISSLPLTKDELYFFGFLGEAAFQYAKSSYFQVPLLFVCWLLYYSLTYYLHVLLSYSLPNDFFFFSFLSEAYPVLYFIIPQKTLHDPR